MKKRGARPARTAIWIMLALSVCVMAASLYKLREIQLTYKAGSDHYSGLADQVRSANIDDMGPPGISDTSSDEFSGSADTLSGITPEKSDTLSDAARDTAGSLSGLSIKPSVVQTGAREIYPAIDIPDISIDFNALRAINPDASAWLYCPDTAIDYPVMRADDFEYYLRHLPDGTVNANGSLFTDYNNAADFSGGLTVIYGHHMKSGQMFGSLTGYKKQAYFEAHPYMYLYTGDANYRIDLIYGFVIGAEVWRERAFMLEANSDDLLAYAARKTTFASGAEYAQGDRLVALYTCAYDFDDASYVVLGVMRPEYGGG